MERPNTARKATEWAVIVDKLMSREELKNAIERDGGDFNDFLDFCTKRNSIAYVENPRTGKVEKFVVTGYYKNGDISGHFLDD